MTCGLSRQPNKTLVTIETTDYDNNFVFVWISATLDTSLFTVPSIEGSYNNIGVEMYSKGDIKEISSVPLTRII